MAIIHRASITPTKAELLEGLLGGAPTVLGTYRFDDPEGEVGVEAFIVRSGDQLRQVVLSYRGAPREGAEDDLVSTMDHSVLGRRWIYDGTQDPVAVECFRRALNGGQEQAVNEVWSDGVLVDTIEPTARLTLVPGQPATEGAAPAIASAPGLSPQESTGPHLRAEWDGGSAIVATLD